MAVKHEGPSERHRRTDNILGSKMNLTPFFPLKENAVYFFKPFSYSYSCFLDDFQLFVDLQTLCVEFILKNVFSLVFLTFLGKTMT